MLRWNRVKSGAFEDGAQSSHWIEYITVYCCVYRLINGIENITDCDGDEAEKNQPAAVLTHAALVTSFYFTLSGNVQFKVSEHSLLATIASAHLTLSLYSLWITLLEDYKELRSSAGQDYIGARPVLI